MASEEATTPTASSPTLTRRVTASSWSDPTSPVVYAKIDVDVTDIEPKLKELSEKKGVKVTLTSLVVWALSRAIAENPDVNNVVRAGELKQLPSVNIAVGIALPESESVWPAKIPDADKKSLLDIAEKLKKDKQLIHESQKNKIDKYTVSDWLMPTSIVRFFQNTATALETDWGLNLSRFGVDSSSYQPFSAVVTCLHRYGLTEAFATFPSTQPTPLALSIGLASVKPGIFNGAVLPRRIVSLCLTIDHRVVNGKLGGKLVHSIKNLLLSFSSDPFSSSSSTPGSPMAKL